MIFIYITCSNKKEAKKIGLTLVKKRLAACCNIFPIESIYWWQDKVAKDREVVLIAKTLKKNFKKVEKEVKKLHGYKVPCILEISIKEGNIKYLNWLKNALSITKKD
jgi:periplasmic divalent cation tolerance protein